VERSDAEIVQTDALVVRATDLAALMVRVHPEVPEKVDFVSPETDCCS